MARVKHEKFVDSRNDLHHDSNYTALLRRRPLYQTHIFGINTGTRNAPLLLLRYSTNACGKNKGNHGFPLAEAPSQA
jgi:hypothetical protein